VSVMTIFGWSCWILIPAFGGLSPFGNLLIGFVAERIGAPLAVIGGAMVCIVMVVIAFFSPVMNHGAKRWKKDAEAS